MSGQQKAQGQWNKVKDTDCVCVCVSSAYRVWEIPMLHWEGWEVTLLVGTSVCICWFRSILQETDGVTLRLTSFSCSVFFRALTVTVRPD